MKRLVPIIALLAMAIPSGAQTIQKGNKFFNGETLYTVQEIRMGTIVYILEQHDLIGKDVRGALGSTAEMCRFNAVNLLSISVFFPNVNQNKCM